MKQQIKINSGCVLFVCVFVMCLLLLVYPTAMLPVFGQVLVPTPTSTPFIGDPPLPTPEPDPITDTFTLYLPLVLNGVQCDDSVAPEHTFTLVGSTARFMGFNGLRGTAVVAGLQTLIVFDFAFAGNTAASIWLAKYPDLDKPVYKLMDLEQRVYRGEAFNLHIPCWLTPGSADYIIVQGDGPYWGTLAAEWFNNVGIPEE